MPKKIETLEEKRARGDQSYNVYSDYVQAFECYQGVDETLSAKIGNKKHPEVSITELRDLLKILFAKAVSAHATYDFGTAINTYYRAMQIMLRYEPNKTDIELLLKMYSNLERLFTHPHTSNERKLFRLAAAIYNKPENPVFSDQDRTLLFASQDLKSESPTYLAGLSLVISLMTHMHTYKLLGNAQLNDEKNSKVFIQIADRIQDAIGVLNPSSTMTDDKMSARAMYSKAGLFATARAGKEIRFKLASHPVECRPIAPYKP